MGLCYTSTTDPVGLVVGGNLHHMDVPWTPFDPNWEYLTDDDPRWSKMDTNSQKLYQLWQYRNYVRRSPLSFAKAFTPGTQELYYHQFISDTIVKLINNELLNADGSVADNLIVTMPPRHGKSYIISEHTPAWYLSLFPNDEVILTTYEADFAASWGKKNKDLIDRSGPALGLALDPTSKANARWNLQGYRGSMQTAGMGGPITGKGGNLLIGDDWVKNSEEANSETWRENAWDWTVSTFLSRKNTVIDPETGEPIRYAKTILLMTRWNDDDPVGRLLRLEPDEWHVIEIPAIAREDDPVGRQPGEALWPQKYPVEYLKKIQKRGSYWFSALYQCRPTPDDGGLFSESTFRYWRSPENGRFNEMDNRAYANSYVLMQPDGGVEYVSKSDCFHFTIADLAITTKAASDFTVFGSFAWDKRTGSLILTGLRRLKIEGPEHLPELSKFLIEKERNGEPQAFVGIEKVTHGLNLLQQARRENAFLTRELPVDKDKLTRAIAASTLAANGQFYIPRDADWLDDFKHELVTFPNAGHDDQVDVVSGAAYVVNTWLFKAKDPVPVRGTATPMQERIENYFNKRAQAKKRYMKAVRNRL